MSQYNKVNSYKADFLGKPQVFHNVYTLSLKNKGDSRNRLRPPVHWPQGMKKLPDPLLEKVKATVISQLSQSEEISQHP